MVLCPGEIMFLHWLGCSSAWRGKGIGGFSLEGQMDCWGPEGIFLEFGVGSCFWDDAECPFIK